MLVDFKLEFVAGKFSKSFMLVLVGAPNSYGPPLSVYLKIIRSFENCFKSNSYMYLYRRSRKHFMDIYAMYIDKNVNRSTWPYPNVAA